MDLLSRLRDYYFYTENFFKIKTKVNGLQTFKLRKYQRRFIDFVGEIQGPVRVIVLKPRQAGFSTLVSSLMCHKMFTQNHFTGIAMADKKKRTESIADIYSNFFRQLPKELQPMVSTFNTEQLYLDNPKESDRALNPGLGSGS